MEGPLKRKGLADEEQLAKRKRNDGSLFKEQSNGSSSRWKFLPHHVILLVFLELSEIDLAQCSRVCQTWHHTLRDDIFWKKLFTNHWNARSGALLRPKAVSWYAEYKRFFAVGQKAPSKVLSVHGGEKVQDLTFSHSGSYLCTSSRGMIVMWKRERQMWRREQPFTVFNKLCYSTPGPEEMINSPDATDGVMFTIFNESDDFVLVNGRAMRLEDQGTQMFHILIYKFPECYLVRSIKWDIHKDYYDNSNPCWFGGLTFLVTEDTEAGYEGIVVLHSVFESMSDKVLISEDCDIESLVVLNDVASCRKVLVYAHGDDALVQSDGYSMLPHNVTLCSIRCSLPDNNSEHECLPDPSVACCVNAKYRSPHPVDFTVDESSTQTRHLCAAIRQVDDAMSQNCIVVCRPYDKTPHGITYSDERLDLRIYDLQFNLTRVIPLQSMVPPSLFIFEHDYWIDENCVLIAGDLNPERLYFHDFYYNVTIAKNTQHSKVINCAAFSKQGVLCTASDDGLVKFWNS